MNRQSFGHQTTTTEVLEGIDLTGKRVLITGASSGLGAEAARAMAEKGAEVIMTARNMEKGQKVLDSIIETTGNNNVSMMSLELGSLKSVRAFAAEFSAKYDSLQILINNAGVMACPQNVTEDGFELQFGVCHLGHFLLTNLLTPALENGAPSRIVALSSRAHRISPVVFDDIFFKSRTYHPWSSYGQAKTANVLHAVELDRRLQSKGIRAYAVHPGLIETDLSRHLVGEDAKLFEKMKNELKTIPQGAATEVYAATAPELEGKGGMYLYDCKISKTKDEEPDNIDAVKTYALDVESAKKLWEVSEQMIDGVKE